jgi:glycine dehydrogenase subunit 2
MSRVTPILTIEEPLLFEKSQPGRIGYSFPKLDVPEVLADTIWKDIEPRAQVDGFPEISENEVVRHFTRLSQKNCAIDLGLYPLGSCTMKYNPKINEEIAQRKSFSQSHPFWTSRFLSPAFRVQLELQKLLTAITGLEAFSLQPSAGAHGEFTGMKIIQAYHRNKSNHHKTKILIPESAHGTNPATCAMLGYEIVSIPTHPSGVVQVSDIQPLLSDEVAGIMMTNPNTCGLFETHIREIADLLHSKDALFYMDGANFNAILGITRPADLGVDVMHINLHKTFSTPHGGGGPGAGAVGVRAFLKDFLPTPTIHESSDAEVQIIEKSPLSIGRVGGFYGNFSILVRALAYMLSIGRKPSGEGAYFKDIAEAAVLNANYIRHRLKDHFSIPFDRNCMHEVLLSDSLQQEFGIKTNDIAKRLMDYGYHPMTVYFPLVVQGAMLIEPTESETKENLDEFCAAMIAIAKEARESPEILHSAPHLAFRKKVDELRAQKSARLRWSPS